MNDPKRLNCIELSLDSSDDEDDLTTSVQQAKSSCSNHLHPEEAISTRMTCVELSLDTSDEDSDYGLATNIQICDHVVEGVLNGHTTGKRVATASGQAKPKKKKRKFKPNDLRAFVLSRAFVNIASVVSRLRSNLSLLASVEDALVLAAQQSSRQHTFKDFQAMAEVYVATLACNVLYGDGQLMKKMADFHSAHHRTALTTFATLMEKDSSALHAANQTHNSNRTMIAAFLASIPHLGRDHASMLDVLGFTTDYLDAFMTAVAVLPRQYTEKGNLPLLEWLELASAQTVDNFLISSVSSGRLNTFLVFFSCLLAAIPHEVVFVKYETVVLSLLRIMLRGEHRYGIYDMMESEDGRQLAQCIQTGSPTELPHYTLEYLQQDVSQACVLQSRVALILFVWFVLHRRKQCDAMEFVVAVGHLDNHLTLHIIHGLTQCQLMGFEARHDEIMEVAFAFAVDGLSLRRVDRFAASLPEYVWQQLLTFPSLKSTTIPAAYDRLNFRFRQCLSVAAADQKQQYVGRALHLSQQLHILVAIVKAYSKGAAALASFVESNLLLANLLWKSIFVNFIAVSRKDNYVPSEGDVAWLRAVRTTHCLRLKLPKFPLSSKHCAWTASQTLSFFLVHTIKLICAIGESASATPELTRKQLFVELKTLLAKKTLPENMVENLFCIQSASELINVWTVIVSAHSK